MKNIRTIARDILERRNLSTTLMLGEMLKIIGPEGYKEALRRRWIEPNFETSFLQITNNQSMLAEMRRIISEEDPQIGDNVVVAEDGQSFNGVVQKINPDGTVALSFGDQHPAVVKPSYQKTEVRVIRPDEPKNEAPVPARPTTGPSTMSYAGPRGPGIGS